MVILIYTVVRVSHGAFITGCRAGAFTVPFGFAHRGVVLCVYCVSPRCVIHEQGNKTTKDTSPLSSSCCVPCAAARVVYFGLSLAHCSVAAASCLRVRTPAASRRAACVCAHFSAPSPPAAFPCPLPLPLPRSLAQPPSELSCCLRACSG